MESSEVINELENVTDNCSEIKKVARFKGTLVFTDVGGRQRLSGTIHRPRKLNLLPEMEAKERKMGLEKAPASFKCTTFAVFQIHLLQRMLLQGKSSLQRVCQEQQTFENTLAFFMTTLVLLAKPLPLSQLRQLMSTSKLR